VRYQEEEREKAREKRNVFSLDLNTVTESLLNILGKKQKNTMEVTEYLYNISLVSSTVYAVNM